jgi:hypothetical protein
MGSENAHGCAQNVENGHEFLYHIVTGEETLVSFVNVQTKEQSKQWMYTYSPNKPRKFKQMSARRLMATVFFYRKGVLMVEFMQQGTTITSEVYYKTLNCIGPFRTNGVEC